MQQTFRKSEISRRDALDTKIQTGSRGHYLAYHGP